MAAPIHRSSLPALAAFGIGPVPADNVRQLPRAAAFRRAAVELRWLSRTAAPVDLRRLLGAAVLQRAAVELRRLSRTAARVGLRRLPGAAVLQQAAVFKQYYP